MDLHCLLTGIAFTIIIIIILTSVLGKLHVKTLEWISLVPGQSQIVSLIQVMVQWVM
jgi:hypothetical protein